MNRWRDRSRCRASGRTSRHPSGRTRTAYVKTSNHGRERRRPVPIGGKPGRYGCARTHDGCVSGGALMTGRLGIDDVTPIVGDGHHPSQGRRRRGRPDRRHGLARGARRDRGQRRVEEGRQRRAGRARPDGPDARRRRPLHRGGRARTSRACGPSGSTPGATRGPPGDTPSPSSSTPGRARTSWPTTSRSARGCCSAWAAAPPSAPTATCSSPRRTRCATRRCRCRSASSPRSSPPSRRSWSSGRSAS